MYRIQTDARVITGNTTEINNRGRRPRFYPRNLLSPVNASNLMGLYQPAENTTATCHGDAEF